LYALAELSYLRARDILAKPAAAAPLLLACTVYSYAYVAGAAAAPAGTPPDNAAQNALAFYNYALGRYLMLAARTQIRYAQGLRLRLTHGYVALDQRAYKLLWQPGELDEYKVAYEYEATGMDVYQVKCGIGVPMIAIRRPPTNQVTTAAERYLPQTELTYAATVILRSAPTATLDARGRHVWQATLEVCDPVQTEVVPVGARLLPLAADLTTPLAYRIEQAPSPSGFAGMLNPASYQSHQGLFMLQPYQPDKIPVVFVHGLMSSPQAWLQMLNYLMGDPALRRRYQLWFFKYPTGNPVLYSASILRDALQGARHLYDPAGTNAAFNQMVVVGHSMGGLLTKTLVQTSSNHLWRLIADVPPDKLELTESERALVDNVIFFRAQPYIARVVFMATPHRGSRFALRPIARLGAMLTTLPRTLVDPGASLIEQIAARNAQAPQSEAAARIEGSMTGIDSLSPDNPGLGVLCALPITVPFHSVIGNNKQAGVPGGTDGIVPYTSSHLEGAQSELIVKSDHSVEENLNAIREVRRILLLHLE
jgi:pimeloyl-ACP methyl ester carboxylesterase